MKWRFLAVLAIVGFYFPCEARAAVRATVVTSRALGIRVTRPAGWHTLTASEHEENLERVDMNPDVRSRAINVSGTALIVTKFKEPYGNLNPSVEIDVRDAGDLEGESASYILNAALDSLLADGQLVTNVQDTTVGGRPAAYVRVDHVLRVRGKAFPTASELWVIPRGRYFVLIDAGTRVDQANGTRAEVHRVVQSIRFTR